MLKILHGIPLPYPYRFRKIGFGRLVANGWRGGRRLTPPDP